MKVHQADFSKGKVSTLILRVAFPLIVAEFVNLLYNMRPYDYTEMFDMMADELYDDEILFTGELFSKDW